MKTAQGVKVTFKVEFMTKSFLCKYIFISECAKTTEHKQYSASQPNINVAAIKENRKYSD